MSREEIKEMIIEVMNEVLEKEVKDEFETTNFVYEFSLNSIDVIELLLAIENKFDFEFDDEDLNQYTLERGDRLLDIVEKMLS